MEQKTDTWQTHHHATFQLQKKKNTNTQSQIQIEIDKCLKIQPLIRETFKISYTFPVIISAWDPISLMGA